MRQIDLVHFLDFKIKDNQDITIGIQYRFREILNDIESNELRLVQQHNVTKKTTKWRLSYRVRAEQPITDKPTIHRFRYRFAIDFPLQEEALDVGEHYAVFSAKSLLSVTKTLLPEYNQRVDV